MEHEGLNSNKQKEVKLLRNNEQVGIIGLLENKIKSNRVGEIANSLFAGWLCLTNLEANLES